MVCPICKKPIEEPLPGKPAPPYYPFCSERCQLIDLGRWLDGRYQIPDPGDEEAPPHEEH